VQLEIIYVAGHTGSNSESNLGLADFGIVSQFQFAFGEQGSNCSSDLLFL
jgi:hypothetical protein